MEEDISRQWHRRLADGGWIAPAWPRAWGGLELGLLHRMVMEEEMARVKAPVPIGFSGIDILGSALLAEGTDEQRQRFLPPIYRADEIWCQGYSEPGSGSDLASLRTRAVRDGEEYVVTGQKVWTSYGARADWVFLLVRTGDEASRHRGLSLLLAPMSTTGIEWRPIAALTGERHFGELFLDDARIPIANRLGGEGDGWRIATHSLVFERMMSGNGAGPLRARLDALRRLVDGTGATPIIRQEMGRLECEVRGVAGLQSRALSLALRGDALAGSLAAGVKVRSSEVRIDIARVAFAVLGPHAVASGPDYAAPSASLSGGAASAWAWELLDSLSGPIYAGTNQILRNVIGEGLGLPR